jgi:lambda family phage portal protein
MINFLEKFIANVAPKLAVQRALARRSLSILSTEAGYEGAGRGRRGFHGSGASQNTVMRRDLVWMRNNAREFQRNNPYAASALQAVVSGTIGGGIKPVAHHPTSKKKKKLADQLMAEWAASTFCDYEGQLNLFGLQSLAMQTESLSGEALLVRHIVNDRTMAVPLKLQLLEGDFLDHTKDGILAGKQATVQGVQINNGRREGYWLFDSNPSELSGKSPLSSLVNADQIAHIFDQVRPGQVRGVPRGISAFTRLKILDDYQDARLELQRMASCLVGLIYNEDNEGEGDILPGRMEPGLMARLNGDERVTFNTPPSAGDHASFIVPEQRIIASAWGITYEALTGDYSTVNFASGKMGRIQMFSNVHRWRYNMMIPKFCKTIEAWFLMAASFRGHDLSGVTFDWTPPKKEILDPAAEIPAIIKEIRAGLNSFQGACRERGIDHETLLRQIKEDIDLFDQYGLVLDIDPRRTTNSGQMQSAVNSGEGVDLSTKDKGIPGDEDD